MTAIVPECYRLQFSRLGAGREERACFHFTVSLREQQARKQPALIEN